MRGGVLFLRPRPMLHITKLIAQRMQVGMQAHDD
jgi:hypothetical protein